MKRRIGWMVAALVVCTLWTRPAFAQDRASGEFGLGLIVGSPTGLSLEYGLTSSSSLHGAIGFEGINDDGRDDDFYLHLVWRFYLAELARTADFSLPVYIGVGPYLADIGNDNNDDIDLGARVPFGIAFAFNSVPIDIFLEIPLYLQIVDDVSLGVGGALGFHYFF